MAKRLSAAVLWLLSAVAVGQAGEKDIIERLKKAGVRVDQINEDGEKDVLLAEVYQRHSDSDRTELCELHRLRALGLNGSGVTDAGMRTVGGLTGLKSLQVHATKVTDTGLKELKGLRRLKCLTLTGTRVTDAGLKELTGLEDLKELYLNETAVTDAGMKTVCGLRRLNCLVLSDTRVTDAGLGDLAGVSELCWLSLGDFPGVTDAGIDRLARLKGLGRVDLEGKGVTEEGC